MHWEDRIGRRLKLRDLHTLQAVAQSGSMAKAAGYLAVSQSAVSKSISQMEHTLGVPLLDRAAGGVEPTAYARVLLKRGAAIFDELRQGIEEIGFLADPTAGEVRIGSTEPVTALIAAVIDRLVQKYPRIVFHTTVSDTTTLFRDLRERTIDLAVTRIVQPSAEKDLTADVLFDDGLAVVAGARSPWARARKVEIAELLEESWTLPPADSFLGRFVVEGFQASGFPLPPTTVITSSTHMRTNLLATGRFLTVLPMAMLKFPAYREVLVALPVELSGTHRPIGLVTLRHRDLSPVVELFIDSMRDEAKRWKKDLTSRS